MTVFVICNNFRSVCVVKNQIADHGFNPNDHRLVYISDTGHVERLLGIQRGTPYYVDSWPDRSLRVSQEIQVREFTELKKFSDLIAHLKGAQP